MDDITLQKRELGANVPSLQFDEMSNEYYYNYGGISQFHQSQHTNNREYQSKNEIKNKNNYYDLNRNSFYESSENHGQYRKPLSHIRLISNLIKSPEVSSNYRNLNMRTTRKTKQQIPIVVITAGLVPLNLDIHSRSSLINLIQTQQNRLPKTTYNNDENMLSNQVIIRPVTENDQTVLYRHQRPPPSRFDEHQQTEMNQYLNDISHNAYDQQ